MRDDFGDAVGDALRSVMLFLPKAVAFVAILVAGWLIAKAVLKIVNKVLERVGFDRAVERGGIRRALARSRYDASDIVAKLAYYGVLLVTLQVAFGIWGPNPVSDLIAGVIAWLPRAFVGIVIVVVAAAIANAVKDIISGALGGLSYGRILATIASVFILGLGVIAALNQIGVATAVTTPVLIAVLATVGGILVVGVGGGLVRPMQSRWESWLTRAEQESRLIATHARAYRAGRRDSEAHLAARATDADATQVVPRPGGPAGLGGDADATQVVARSGGPAGLGGDADATQVVPRAADTGGPATPQADPEATQVTSTGATIPAQPTGQDAEATMVIPPLGEEKFRR
ncbi:Conserved TM helix [Micromonospora citrea]|uniref:Conserved TM helix n=1 Tax=Micromonospora citrea TaxID=47855 RepID=A0A1C6TQL2_9ACTN|nr:Conserved TM helix [Micromonospora citrea]